MGKRPEASQKGKRLTVPENDFSLYPSLPASLCRPIAVQCPLTVSTIPHRLLHAASTEGGSAMTFEEMLDHALAMLQRRGRLTYRTLQRQFHLDDDALNDLKDAL